MPPFAGEARFEGKEETKVYAARSPGNERPAECFESLAGFPANRNRSGGLQGSLRGTVSTCRRIGIQASAIFQRFAVFLRRKELIQPQVPLRLPCYDFIPVTSLTLGRCL